MTYSIDLDDDEAQRKLKELAVFLTDLRPMWPVVGKVFVTWMDRQFESEGKFAGNPWAQLAESTRRYKALHYPGRKILQRTGAMKGAFMNPAREGTHDTLKLTVTNPYAGYHQEGTPRMPARPIIFGDPLPAAAYAMFRTAVYGYADDLMHRIFD